MNCMLKNNPVVLDIAALLMRGMLGAVFIYHGYPKIIDIPALAENFGPEGMDLPLPMFAATCAALSEFVGGIALVLGFLTRIAALPMAFTMGVAVTMVHWGAFGAKHNGMEYPLTLGVMLIALALIGPGRVSLDQLMFGNCCRKRDPEPAGE